VKIAQEKRTPRQTLGFFVGRIEKKDPADFKDPAEWRGYKKSEPSLTRFFISLKFIFN
jgi:hypothetical protein